MVSIAVLAALGGLSAAAATAATTGDASTVVSAIHVAPPGLHVALSHVPSWTHAYQVLTQHLSAYAQNGGASAAGTAGVGAAIKKGLHLGLQR